MHRFSCPKHIFLRFCLAVFSIATISAVESREAFAATEESSTEYKLVQKSYSTGVSSVVGIAGTKLDAPIAVQVLKKGEPAAGERVDFLLTAIPDEANGTALSADHATTDHEGIARVKLTLGDAEGQYLVAAYLQGEVKAAEPLTTKVKAMESAWVMFLVFWLIGGLGLFLYGMNIASDNLQRAAGDQMRVLIGKLTRNRVSALLVGTVASGVLQSSSAATVMLVGFVSAGMMTLTQAIGVTMGAKVGVTITVQVIAFNISKYALAPVGLGSLMIMFAGNKEKMKQIGAILLGFGLIFFGLALMSDAMKPLRGMPEVAALMITFGDNAALAMLAGTAVTAVIQSAAAMVAVCFVLASQGLLSLEAAIPLSIGGAVGTCATALLASISSNKDGKRVAIAHLIFSVSAAVVMFPFLGPFSDFVRGFTALLGSDSIIRQIANGFMLFSIVTAVAFLPFIAPIEWLTRRIVRASKEEEPFGPKYVNAAALQVPLMALEQAQKEVERLAELFGETLKSSVSAIVQGDKALLGRLSGESEKLDVLEKAIRPFLAELARKGLSRSDSARERALIYVTEHLVSAGHLLTKEVISAGEKFADSSASFSDEGAAELTTFHEKLVAKFARILEMIRTGDRAIAEQVLQLSFKEAQLERKLRASHLERLHEGKAKSVESSGDHLSILVGMNAVRSKLDDVADEILQEL